MTEKTTLVARVAKQIELNPERKKRTGPEPLSAEEKRTITVSVRLNEAEAQLLDSQRGRLARGEWMRMAALDQLPPQIPAINREAWAALSRTAANLNQVAKKLNGGDSIGIADAQELVATLRAALLGAAL